MEIDIDLETTAPSIIAARNYLRSVGLSTLASDVTGDCVDPDCCHDGDDIIPHWDGWNWASEETRKHMMHAFYHGHAAAGHDPELLHVAGSNQYLIDCPCFPNEDEEI